MRGIQLRMEVPGKSRRMVITKAEGSMRKLSSTSKKSVSEANLTALGAVRLAALLLEAASGDAGLKRRLRMELAAELGSQDLAVEIDKRLMVLAGGRTRVSWRKRPILIRDLTVLLRMIADRLAPLDIRSALDRLVAWFDLYPALSSRVSDAKGELPLVFDAASSDLVFLASEAGPDIAAPVLSEALSTRLDPWARWVTRGIDAMTPELAGRLLVELTQNRARPTGRLALVVRKLADQCGNLDMWIASISDEDRRRPGMGAQIAHRLATAGRPAEARAALESSRKFPRPATRWGRMRADSEPSIDDAWLAAEIAVLDAEGRDEAADLARWRHFERSLSPDDLRVLLAKLPDFEDVVALDKAFDLAAQHPDAMKGLTFLMAWPALREAAALVEARREEIRGAYDDITLWAARLASRHPLAALLLYRARARILVTMAGFSDEVRGLIDEAQALAAEAPVTPPETSHAAFAAELERLVALKPRRRL